MKRINLLFAFIGFAICFACEKQPNTDFPNSVLIEIYGLEVFAPRNEQKNVQIEIKGEYLGKENVKHPLFHEKWDSPVCRKNYLPVKKELNNFYEGNWEITVLAGSWTSSCIIELTVERDKLSPISFRYGRSHCEL